MERVRLSPATTYGILTGAIDKLLITPSGNGRFDIEIIDFKTNRLRPRLADDAEASAATRSSLSGAPALRDFQGSGIGRAAQPAWQRGGPAGVPSRRPRNPATPGQGQQFAFDFSTSERGTVAALDTDSNFSAVLLQAEVARAASDYQLQMQAYALAARELLPSPMNEHNRIKVTLHFLDPNVEYSLPKELLEPSNCSRAIDEAITEIISAREPRNFPVRPANHCRMCNFLVLCSSGREWLRQNRS